MTCPAKNAEKPKENVPVGVLDLEVRGREEVNRLLQAGWRLLHIYTLKYEEDGVWRERPMAILGKLRNPGPKLAAAGPTDNEARIHAVKSEV